MNNLTKKKMITIIIVYLITAYVIGGIGFYMWYVLGLEYAAGIATLSPLVGGIVAYFMSSKTLDLRLHFDLKGILLGGCIPVIYLALTIAGYLISGKRFTSGTVTVKFVAILIVQWIFSGFCEEFGWRNIILPLTKKLTGFKRACFITGVFWFIWHIPMTFGGSIVAAHCIPEGLLLFFIQVISISFILGILSCLKVGKSITTYISFHAMHNIVFLIFFKFIPEENMKYIDDGGYIFIPALVITTVVFAIIFRKKIKESKGNGGITT